MRDESFWCFPFSEKVRRFPFREKDSQFLFREKASDSDSIRFELFLFRQTAWGERVAAA
jgi:hypothetical protein